MIDCSLLKKFWCHNIFGNIEFCPGWLTNEVISDKVYCLNRHAGSIRATSQSKTDLTLTLQHPSLNRSRIYWYLRG